jgi:hypothetical protein
MPRRAGAQATLTGSGAGEVRFGFVSASGEEDVIVAW